MKAGAWLFLVAATLILSSVGTLVYAVYEDLPPVGLPTFGAFLLGLVLLIFYRVMASSARCPLCSFPVLLSKKCQRNRNANRFLGSYRARVARDIVLFKSFRCPYCGEPTMCVPRERGQEP